MQALLSTNLIPDPYGAYHHFRIPKQPGQPLGVSFGFRPAFSHSSSSSSSSSSSQQQQQSSSSSRQQQTIQITKITPTSVLQHPNTTIQCGQELVAINGQAIASPQQALSMIQQSSVDGHVEIKTLYKPSFCYTATLPINNRLYASIHFSDNRRGMIVSVGRVFTTNRHHNMPTSHSQQLPHEGDLVLSVNGIPVKQARQAEQLIVDACRAGKTSIELYCLDLDAFVYKVAKQVAAAVPDRLSPYGMVITKDAGSSRLEAKCDYVIACGNTTNTHKGNAAGGKYKARFVLDRANSTLQLVNAEPYRHLELSSSDHSSLQLEKRYRKVIYPFVQDLNAVLEHNMRLLEEAICHRVWEHAVCIVPSSTIHEQQQQQQEGGEAVAITTTYPAHDSTAAAAATAPLPSQGGGDTNSGGTIPMATAVVAQVIPPAEGEQPPHHQPEPTTEVVIQVPSSSSTTMTTSAARRIPPPLGDEDENQGMADADDNVDPEEVVV